jgi:tetratricopeptide (TPR) repeat protein
VVTALEVELVGASNAELVALGTENLEAYQAYLQGLFFWNKRTTADMERSAEYFHRAIAADSGFALAWAGLASAYVLFVPSEYHVTSIAPAEALDRAEAAARRALALDPNSGPALTALGAIQEKSGLEEDAGASYRRAIEVDPTYPTARQWYATYVAEAGDANEGLKQILEAARLDPLSLVILVEVGELLDVLGRNAEATAQYEHVLELYPDAQIAHYFAGIHFLMQRDFERAGTLLGREYIASSGDSAGGNRLADIIRDPVIRPTALPRIADDSRARAELTMAIHRVFGDDDAAVAAFERAVDGPDFELVYLAHLLAVLGPDLSAQERVRAAIERHAARLREHYGR